MYRSGMGGMDRDFGHSDMPMNRGFGDSFGGMGERNSDVDSHNTKLKLYVLYVSMALSNLHQLLFFPP